MTRYDLCLLHYEDSENEFGDVIIRSNKTTRLVVRQFDAAGKKINLWQGKEWGVSKSSSSYTPEENYGMYEEYEQEARNLIVDGWERIGRSNTSYASGDIFCRKTSIPQAETLPRLERLKLLNQAIQNKEEYGFSMCMFETLEKIKWDTP